MNSLDLKYYFAIFWRRLPWFLMVAGLITGLGLAVAVLLPPTYRSSASILVESQQITEDLANPTVQVNAVEVIQVIERRLLTRPNLLDIADRFDIFEGETLTATQIVDRMRGATEFRQTSFGTDRRPGANAFSISFQHRSPRLAADVTNEFVTLVLQENAEIRTGRAEQTAEFFELQVEDLGQELTAIEGEILVFKNENKDALPDSLEFRRNQLGILQERLLGLEREEAVLREQLAVFEAALENPEITVLPQAEPQTPLEREIAQLERALVQQSAIFSDTNPNIIALQNRIEALRAALPAQAGALTESGDGARDQIVFQIEQVQARLDTLRVQKGSVEAEIESLNSSIRATPGNEMQLNVLDRNYANLTEQYNRARQKLAEALQGERIELQRQGERFSVIEQATPPEQPESPNRPIIAVGAAGAGIVAGLGLIVLLEFLNPAVRRPVEITRKLNMPIFETVPLIRTTGERRRRAAIWGVLGVTLAGGVAAGVWALHTYYLPLDLILSKVWSVTGLSGLLGG